MNCLPRTFPDPVDAGVLGKYRHCPQSLTFILTYWWVRVVHYLLPPVIDVSHFALGFTLYFVTQKSLPQKPLNKDRIHVFNVTEGRKHSHKPGHARKAFVDTTQPGWPSRPWAP